ncbi:DUF3846 domain-containing protein [Antrihabitans sp. YC2-6]|uniref:DUF3846 domain-containing protein n=1 Tax=Antrihabitans sp. YC2-6 TaxID=2799498 RepID=UPI0018F54E43|nr:DUF3846 domain-containing protein [Antrihabitans sp. YC2-6]MBJ8343977.1 DUF3846 domain-containing protein [Antrihabitans sp. YC2-6]
MTLIDAVLIPADPAKDVERVQFAPSDLKYLQTAVGGYIEPVNHQTPPSTVFVNEDGANSDLPPNTRATQYLLGTPIKGNAVVTGTANSAGDVTSVSKTVLEIFGF